MMINISRLDVQIEKVKGNIKNYEMIIYETLSTAKNMSFYWNDGYTEAFFKKIDNTIQNTNDLVNSLYSMLSFIKNLSSLYNSVNRTRLYTFGYAGATINSNSFIVRGSDDEEIAYKKRSIYNAIMSAENQAASYISGVNIPYIEKINFENMEKGDYNSTDFVGMTDEMPNEIKRLEQRKNDAKNAAERLKDSFYSIASFYSSSNSRIISQKINEISDALYSLNLNLNSACDYINQRREKYKETFSELADEIRNQGNN